MGGHATDTQHFQSICPQTRCVERQTSKKKTDTATSSWSTYIYSMYVVWKWGLQLELISLALHIETIASGYIQCAEIALNTARFDRFLLYVGRGRHTKCFPYKL